MQKIITIFQCFTCSNIAIDALMRQSKLTEVEKKKKKKHRKTKNNIDRKSETEHVNY